MLKVNDILGNWKVISKKPISVGGQSEIYSVKNIENISNEAYVLKLYKKQGPWRASYIERFHKEIKALELLKNEKNVIEIIESHTGDKDDPNYYVVMRKADCHLEKYLGQKEFDDDEIFEIFYKIIEGVKTIHKSGIIHRDLKPKNLLIKNNEIKIIDFGICYFYSEDSTRDDESRITKILEPVGSRGYIPPESVGGRVEDIDFRFDIFLLGKILYFLLTKGSHLGHIFFNSHQNRIGSIRKDRRYNVFNTFFKKTIAIDTKVRFRDIDDLKTGFDKCKYLFDNYKKLKIAEYHSVPLINSQLLLEIEKKIGKPVKNLEYYEFFDNSFGFVEVDINDQYNYDDESGAKLLEIEQTFETKFNELMSNLGLESPYIDKVLQRVEKFRIYFDWHDFNSVEASLITRPRELENAKVAIQGFGYKDFFTSYRKKADNSNYSLTKKADGNYYEEVLNIGTGQYEAGDTPIPDTVIIKADNGNPVSCGGRFNWYNFKLLEVVIKKMEETWFSETKFYFR